MAADYRTDPGFMAASPEEKHQFLMAVDSNYAKAPPAEQKAFVASFQGQQKPTPGQEIWNAVSYPMRQVAKLGGKMDVATGIKTPEEAQANEQLYGDIGTKILAAALGGKVAGGLAPGHPTLAPAIGRVLTQGGIDALRAPSLKESGAEFAKGAQAATAGELTGAAVSKALHPLAALRKYIPSLGPEVGGKYVRDYEYGIPPGVGFRPDSRPVLLRDVISHEAPPPKPPTAIGQVGQSAYNEALDHLRGLLGL